MSMIKNKEIFLIQIATRPFPKRIYRSLRALLNSTLTRNEFWSFQTQTIHKIDGSKPCIYTFYTNIHTKIHTKTLDFHTQIPYTIRSIHTCDLLFPFLLSSFLFFFFFLSLLFSLIQFCSLFLQDQNEIFILVFSLFDIIPFFFSLFLSFGASLTIQSKEETSSIFPSSHLSLPQFSSLFHYNIFLLLLFSHPTLYYS